MAAIGWLLIHLCIVGAGVIWLMFIPPVDHAAGAAHETISAMRVGGDGASRFAGIMLPAGLIYYGTLGAVAGLVMLALSKGPNATIVNRIIHAISLVSAAIMLALFLTYDHSLTQETITYMLGFPFPSAIAVYAVWAGGLLYCCLYVFGFDRFVYTAAQKEGFEALLQEKAYLQEIRARAEQP